MRGILEQRDVDALQKTADKAARRVSEVGNSHALLGVFGRLHPLALAELCTAWKAQRGIIRKPDCVDVETGWLR
jgi:hypothetical protein